MTSCIGGFKPYYNWTAFNTASKIYRTNSYILCFKPCYKWNTFNTLTAMITSSIDEDRVLNLVISGIPSILKKTLNLRLTLVVLNLVISGIPSIQKLIILVKQCLVKCFKPCYKWNTFNTKLENGINDMGMDMF